MTRTTLLLLALLLTAAACGDPTPPVDRPVADDDTGGADTDDTGGSPDVAADTAEPDVTPDVPQPPACEESGAGALPDGVEWITVDGLSDELIAFSDGVFSREVQGDFGVYDLNRLEVYGANGFYVDGRATVVGAEVRWKNLSRQAEPADHPIGQWSRCVSEADEGAWVRYAFDVPIEVVEPGYVFVGYHRAWVEDEALRGPELAFENHQQEAEPFFAGARFPDWDEETYYKGLATSWYTWQVRLAIVRGEAVPAEAQRFYRAEDLPAIGARVAFGDVDNDGLDDLMTSGPRLLRNLGDGRFEDVTGSAIPGGVVNGSSGGVFGDYDNDELLDYFGEGVGEVLLHNNGDGTFTDVIEGSGIDDLQEVRDCNGDGMPERSPTEGAAWVDLDGDGFLDLYLANYECSSEFDSYQNYADRFFRNQGDGTFVDAGAEVGISTALHAGRGVTVADLDRDGDTDIFVSNYRLDPNFHYENQGNGRLRERAADLGTQGDRVSGAYGHTIGTAVGDLDNDGDFDLVSANLAHPFYYHFSDKTQVLLQSGNGTFRNDAERRGIQYRETHSNPVLFEADNDGDVDLFITCIYAGRDSDFYENDGAGFFTLRNLESGLVVQNGWGAAAADIDNDGDVDVAASGLYLNRGLGDGHFLQVRAVGVGTNTSAIGAVVEVRANGRNQLRAVSGGSGTTSQDSLVQHFGLGDATEAERITVRFPYGESVTIQNVAADQRVWVYSDGTAEVGWAPPRPPGG